MVASAPAKRVLACGLGFFHEVRAKLLVEIGPEGGLRHNSPLMCCTLLRRGRSQRPLRRRIERYPESSSLTRLDYTTLLYFYF
jgi:hypothetical protein